MLELAKNQAKAKQHPEAERLLFENYLLSSSTLSSKKHSKNTRHSKNVQKNKYVCLNIVIRNGKIVWKVTWIEYYLRLNLSSRRY